MPDHSCHAECACQNGGHPVGDFHDTKEVSLAQIIDAIRADERARIRERVLTKQQNALGFYALRGLIALDDILAAIDEGGQDE